ncbi:MAG: ATP-binding protein [bacterium]|nr:ATP-binding protein [bacterium]
MANSSLRQKTIMRETKINLKHLLEDIRDSYTISIENIILVELIANALDSGASKISFFIDSVTKSITVLDNGKGMRRDDLVNYHNIAATTKTRGNGIGFAGVGAKLSLLLSNKVITETKGGRGSHCAAEWHLKNENSAPWKFIPFSDKVIYPRGTAVTIFVSNPNSPLLSNEFIAKAAFNNFYPLFCPYFFNSILKHIYKKGVEFCINGEKIYFDSEKEIGRRKNFQIQIGGGRGKLVGTGFIKIREGREPDGFYGLGISAYGKIIKSGWEWIGIGPKEENNIYGLVEVPIISEILTTNKSDFLKDAASLKKYYLHRKAIQEAILPILAEFGENVESLSNGKQYKSLSGEIDQTLKFIAADFPELVSLFGFRKTNKREAGILMKTAAPLIGIIDSKIEEEIKAKKQSQENESTERNQIDGVLGENTRDGSGKTIRKKPGLIIGFEDKGSKGDLSRIIENRIWINASHPAYLRARKEKLDRYHIVFCVALTLSNFLETERSPQKFINYFLSTWGKTGKRMTGVLKI